MRFFLTTIIELLLLLRTGLVIGNPDNRNFKNGCIVPPKLNNGEYFPGFVPGQLIPNATALRYACNENYIPTTGYGLAYCVSGSWVPNTIECSDYSVYPEVGKSYKFHKNPQNWADARNTCRKENAILAMPENEYEASVLVKLFEKYPVSTLKNVKRPEFVLLGFHDIFSKGDYVTDQGNSIQYYFHTWNKGEPNHATTDENCGSLSRNGKLFDFPCSEPAVFVCQKNTQEIKELVDSDCIPQDPLYRYFNETNKFYKLHLNQALWATARAICKAEGGNLAVIRSKAEETFLLAMFSEPGNRLNHVFYPDHAMIGFHDLFRENHFVTVLGEDMKSIGYANWAPGQPDNFDNNENCGSVHINTYLYDFPCDLPGVFICEISNRPHH